MDNKQTQAFLHRFFPASLFISWIFSFAAARGMQVCFNIPGSFLIPLLYTGLFTVFMSFLLHSKPFRVVTLIVIAILLLVVIFYRDGIVFPFIRDFINWLIQMSMNLTTPEAGWPALAVLLLSIAASMPFAVVTVRWVFLPGEIALYIGFFLWMWLSYGTRSLPYAAIGMVAVAGGFALSFGQYNARKNATPDREYVTLLWVVPTMAVLALGLSLSLGRMESFKKSEWLSSRMDVLQTLISDRTGLMQKQESFSLRQMGLSPLGTQQLGGAVSHQSKLKVMKVQSNEPGVYLRGTVLDEYTGRAWKKSESKYLMRTDMEAFSEILTKSFDGDAAPIEDMPVWFYKDVRLIVYPEDSLTTTSMFTPIRLTSVRSNAALSMLIYFSEYGELYSSRKIKSGMDYTINASLPDYGNPSFSAAVRMYQLSNVLPGSNAYNRYEEIKESYTVLPEDLPQSIYTAAEEISSAYSGDYGLEASIAASGVTIADTSYLTDYSRAKAIEYWLAVNCAYTTEPVTPPEDMDFVAHFLETREGYCTYYASAMTVLARCIGLPARYVEGFRLPDINVHGGMYTLKMTDAHAWCEVYIAGIGWIPFDPLAVDLPDENADDPGDTYVEPTPNPWELQTQTPMPMETGDDAEEVIEVPVDYTWLVLLLAGVVLVGGAALLIVMWLLRTKEKRAYYKTNKGRVHRYYLEIVRLLSYYNAPMQPGETLYAFALRIDKWLYLPNKLKFVEIADLIVRISYARWQPDKADVRKMRTFTRALRVQAFKDVGIFFYFFHHILRVPFRRPEDSKE
ncbi:MAG: transglutaminase domain-containing protein [Christensenellales bacterium]|jgi:transglutaminase-like putative cysteine protease